MLILIPSPSWSAVFCGCGGSTSCGCRCGILFSTT